MREHVRKSLTFTSSHVSLTVRVPGFRNLENFLPVGSGMRENFDMESGIQGFGIQNKA